MTSEIKQKIEQIRNGEVPEGYKRTKAGTIPEKWEIKKLSDVLKKQTQKNTNNEIQNVLTNSATQGIVCQTEYFDKQIANNENTSGYYIVKPGYFVYNPRISVSAPCGPFNIYNGDKDGIMSPLYSVYCFCDKSITYANFLTYYFSSSKWYAYMNSIANYGARSDRMNVTGEDMNNMPIPYPPLPEQQRIVAILSTQDKVIECYEKKIEQLKREKKYYLQNMFPKRGETVPKIRFKGFTDVWENSKLEHVVGIYDGTHQTPNYQDHGVMFVSVEDIQTLSSRKYISKDDYYKNYSVVPEPGDILMTRIGDIGTANIVKTTEPLAFYVSLALLKNKGVNAAFLKANIAAPSIQNELWLRTLHTAYPKKINKDEIGKCKIAVAPSQKEQEQIGKFFENLDNLITLHQRKLEEEKKKKKALQQLLLTGIVRTN